MMRSLFLSLLSAFLLGSPAFAAVAAQSTGAAKPGFMVERRLGPNNWSVHVYDPPATGLFEVDDALVRARVRYVGGDEWTLEITPKPSINLRSVRFPFESNRRPLDSNIDDDRFYFPQLMGSVEDARARNVDFSDPFVRAWPGHAFAPLCIHADDNQARIVVATNWPPLAVAPAYHAERLELWYLDETGLDGALWPSGLANSVPDPGETMVYRFMWSQVQVSAADLSRGIEPWQLALDRYRGWLANRVPLATYPDWMTTLEGIHAIGLHNLPLPPGQPDWIAQNVDQWVAEWEDDLQWVQFWGQMSDYAGDCCFPEWEQHPRYEASHPAITALASEFRSEGLHVGYYASPDWRTPVSHALDNRTGRDFLAKWLATHRGDHADAYYVDVVGRALQGDPADVVRLFPNTIGSSQDLRLTNDMLIEGIVDIYPSAHLMSGSVVGANGFSPADPLTTLGFPASANTVTSKMFPRLSAYLLPERITFLGGGNGESAHWGRANSYRVEREAFLRGAKLIAFQPDEPDGSQNLMVHAIIDARRAAHFWKRSPLYLDTQGLSDVPSGMRASVFEEHAGRHMICVDNPALQTGQQLRFGGVLFDIPGDQVSIIEAQ